MTTGAQIKAALAAVGGIGGQGWSYDTIAAGADEAMRQAGITTREGAATLVAQCMVESAYFRTTREYGGSRARYAPYYGRGFIQVTWRANYAAFGEWCRKRGLVSSSTYFMSPNEDRLADPKWAWLGAVWYFTTHPHGLVNLANRGEVTKVGRAINRGNAYSSYAAYGESHRIAAYNALLRAGISAPGKPIPGAGSSGGGFYVPPKSTTMSVKQIQKAVGVTADGKYGSGTRAAVKRLQGKLKVPEDGLWGPATEAAYKKTLKKPAKKPVVKKPVAKKLTVDGTLGPATIKALQKQVKVAQDGLMGPATVKGLQRWVGTSQDGKIGPATVTALQKKVEVRQDGAWGPATTKALQRWLNEN